MNSPEFTSKLLIKESPLQVLPTLAVRIGLNEAMVLQQLHYKLLAKDARGNRLAHFRDGHYWYYNSYEGWQQLHFKFWSPRTMRRALKSLEAQGLIITKKFRRGGGDHKRWYTVNYSALIALELGPDAISSTSDELANLASTDMANLAKNNGKLATSCNKNTSHEICSKTPSHRKTPPGTRVSVACSRFSRDICEQYAEHLFITQQGIKNPTGFAKQIFRSGEDDSKIEEFLVAQAKQNIDINKCPDCFGRGVHPHSSGKGYVKCQHPTLMHFDTV